MNSISNETLGRLEAYKKISSDVVNKIENNMTYVETLLIYEIMNSNFFNKDKMFFNYQLFSRLTIKKYSKMYEKELKGLRKDLVESLNQDLKYVTDDVKSNIENMIILLDKPIEANFEEKCRVMIENFKGSLEEIIESNAALISSSETSNMNYIDKSQEQIIPKEQIKDMAKIKEKEKKEQEEKIKKEQEIKLKEQEERIKREAEEKLKEKEVKIKQKQEEIKKREEDIKTKKQQIEEENKKLEQENKEIENMLGAIDNMYGEMNQADINQIDYTTFLKYIEEDELEDINLDNIIKEEKSIEINEDLSKTLDDLDLGSKKSFDDMSDILDQANLDVQDNITTKELDYELSKALDDMPSSEDINIEQKDEDLSKTIDDMLELDTNDLMDLNIKDDDINEELSKTLDEIKDVEISSMDLEKELLNSIDLNDIEKTDELVQDIDNLDDLLEGLDEEEKEENTKKSKFGRIKFGFRNK